ncbi:ribosome recycling factor [Bacteriovoracaceae bacterium]|nr:ribosome recycling factor [Bacteriovoracaceae bacterium]
MFEDIQETVSNDMDKSIATLKKQLTKVRTGRATPNVLDGISVSYYGTDTPLAQVGQVSAPEARLLQIQPYDKTMIADIEKAIFKANLGVTPSNDGNFVRIPFPALTEEKRKDLVKSIKKIGEDTKINIRNTRRDHNDSIKKSEKDKSVSEDDSKKIQGKVQDLTDRYIVQVDKIIGEKENELMKV